MRALCFLWFYRETRRTTAICVVFFLNLGGPNKKAPLACYLRLFDVDTYGDGGHGERARKDQLLKGWREILHEAAGLKPVPLMLFGAGAAR